LSAIDTSRPHPARMYDYYLGGKDHYPVDEEAAQEVLRRTPQVRDSTRGNRRWMHRVVRHLAEEHGIRQFLDLGAGLPTPPNLHEVVQEVDPTCRVMYADNDPIVLAHADALLKAAPGGVVEYFQADLHDPGKVLQLARETRVFDWEQPVALVLAAVLRAYDDVVQLFEGTDLLVPGVVRLPEWHPELEAVVGGGLHHDPDMVWAYGGVGRIRETGA
jgi:hypothetical protein